MAGSLHPFDIERLHEKHYTVAYSTTHLICYMWYDNVNTGLLRSSYHSLMIRERTYMCSAIGATFSKIDGLKEMIVAPRPPRRKHSHGSNATSFIGGLCSISKRHASVERLRHSISVARDYDSSSNNSRSNIVVQRHHQEGTCNGNTPVAF